VDRVGQRSFPQRIFVHTRELELIMITYGGLEEFGLSLDSKILNKRRCGLF
jgi:hypothetical protein